ncbi:MAG: four helix bundle protein, partial [Bacteroidota bacterium]|nr:four helix bundle protein [Bacteroidota bacterium]
MTRYEMEDRFIDFAVMINRITDSLGNSKRSLYYADQMVRSASSAALNYGESMSAESKKDFIHK